MSLRRDIIRIPRIFISHTISKEISKTEKSEIRVIRQRYDVTMCTRAAHNVLFSGI